MVYLQVADVGGGLPLLVSHDAVEELVVEREAQLEAEPGKALWTVSLRREGGREVGRGGRGGREM